MDIELECKKALKKHGRLSRSWLQRKFKFTYIAAQMLLKTLLKDRIREYSFRILMKAKISIYLLTTKKGGLMTRIIEGTQEIIYVRTDKEEKKIILDYCSDHKHFCISLSFSEARDLCKILSKECLLN